MAGWGDVHGKLCGVENCDIISPHLSLYLSAAQYFCQQDGNGDEHIKDGNSDDHIKDGNGDDHIIIVIFIG